jgi:DNA/RNA-binding domain of Phe-tRNA-synthetase-like protein
MRIQVAFELEGWSLFFASLELLPGSTDELESLRHVSAARVRERLQIDGLASSPTVAALRKLFRSAGCDPTRYRPSSEALIRRILKGAELPAIHPFVDVNNCLSLELAVPCCVMAEEAVAPPYALRAGRVSESYESLKGPFNLEGKPLLVDAHGPCDVPITGSQRVKIQRQTQRAVLVAYLPEGVVQPATARRRLEMLLTAAPVARLLGSCDYPTQTEETHEHQDG